MDTILVQVPHAIITIHRSVINRYKVVKLLIAASHARIAGAFSETCRAINGYFFPVFEQAEISVAMFELCLFHLQSWYSVSMIVMA